jgi:hypothetical protein
MKMKYPTTILGTLRTNAPLIVERITLAIIVIVVPALLTYLLGLWPMVLGIELGVPETLLFLLIILTLFWFVLRRCRRAEERVYTLEQEAARPSSNLAADYMLRIEGLKVLRGAEEIHLAPHEFKLLQSLVDREGQICEYSTIIEEVWPEESNSPAPPGRENLAALVRRLRDKITVHDYIKNHPGRGYELVQWER